MEDGVGRQVDRNCHAGMAVAATIPRKDGAAKAPLRFLIGCLAAAWRWRDEPRHSNALTI
jgi:hypothetical protein